MRILHGLRAMERPPRRAVVSVGVFDGVHLAHQRLIRATVAVAAQVRGTSVVVTFDPDPQTVLDPSHAQPRLMPLDARVRLLQELGVQWVWVIPFTPSFSRMTPEAFVQRILAQRLHAIRLVVGEQFAFGSGRRGDMPLLRRLGPRYGITVVALPHVRRGGLPVSSSRIRRLISDGRLSQARQLLGRPPELFGTVVRGLGRGRRLGFPTANIRLTSDVMPPQGVYAVTVEDHTRRQRWPGVMNLGVRPTFGAGALVCEVHLLKFSGRVLGRSVKIAVHAWLRHERCFPSWQLLSRQIGRDVARARRVLSAA